MNIVEEFFPSVVVTQLVIWSHSSQGHSEIVAKWSVKVIFDYQHGRLFPCITYVWGADTFSGNIVFIVLWWRAINVYSILINRLSIDNKNTMNWILLKMKLKGKKARKGKHKQI